MVTVLFLLLVLIAWFFLFPVRLLKNPKVSAEVLEPPDLYVYSFVLHLHTQFSHDSLGKPEDVEEALRVCGVDFALVTDHDNDLVGRFSSSRILAGKEVKLSGEDGDLVGDLLDFGSLKVIAHPFTEKYRWKGSREGPELLEIVDLKDEILSSKPRLLAVFLVCLLLYPLLGRRVLRHLLRLVDAERSALRYLREGWRNPVVGGLDHHVKVYIAEVKRKVLIPHYTLSFSLVRNILLTRRRVNSAEDLPKALKEGRTVVSFSEKVPVVWEEGRRLKVYSPYHNTLILLLSPEGVKAEVIGPNCTLDPEPGRYLVLGYTFIFKVWNILFGLRPLFISYPLEVRDEGETSSRLDQEEDTGEGPKQTLGGGGPEVYNPGGEGGRDPVGEGELQGDPPPRPLVHGPSLRQHSPEAHQRRERR
jgi:hypothetical protein